MASAKHDKKSKAEKTSSKGSDFIFVKEDGLVDLVYGNGRFFTHLRRPYQFDFKKDWWLLAILLVAIELSIFVSQYFEMYFHTHVVPTLIAIVVSAYVGVKVARPLAGHLGIGYQARELKRVQGKVDVDEEMIESCQKRYLQLLLQQVLLLVLAVFLYSIFFFTARLYGVVTGLFIMTAFGMSRIMGNYPVYRTFMDTYHPSAISRVGKHGDDDHGPSSGEDDSVELARTDEPSDAASHADAEESTGEPVKRHLFRRPQPTD